MFHCEKNYGLFIGKLSDNKLHKHFALQISVSTDANLKLSMKNRTDVLGNAFLINSKVEHKLISCNTQLTILVNPLCGVGHQLYNKLNNVDFLSLNDYLSSELIDILHKYESKQLDFVSANKAILNALTNEKYHNAQIFHLQDDRIFKVIEYMEQNYEKVLSLEEIATHFHLSPSRLLHLFKEKTNLNFRRFQLWNKVVNSVHYLTKNSITDTAYTFGFSDSSHYTRTFIETFGFTPKFFQQKH